VAVGLFRVSVLLVKGFQAYTRDFKDQGRQLHGEEVEDLLVLLTVQGCCDCRLLFVFALLRLLFLVVLVIVIVSTLVVLFIFLVDIEDLLDDFDDSCQICMGWLGLCVLDYLIKELLPS